MINYDDFTKGTINKHNPNWPEILVHLARMSIIRDSRSGKTNALRNLIKQKNGDDFDIITYIYLFVKDPNEAKYHYLIKKHKEIGLEVHEDPKAFIKYSNNTFKVVNFSDIKFHDVCNF